MTKLIASYLLMFLGGMFFLSLIQYHKAQYSVEKTPQKRAEGLLDFYWSRNEINHGASNSANLFQMNIADELIKAITQCPQITRLDFAYCVLHENQIKALAKGLNLRDIRIIQTNLTDADIDALMNEPLRGVHLDQTLVTREGILKLAGVPTLEVIIANDVDLTLDDLKKMLEINPDIFLETRTMMIFKGEAGTFEDFAKKYPPGNATGSR